MASRTSIALAALLCDDLVLMVHRHPARLVYPDCWDLVGGHIDSGESPHQAVSRECREEIGVDIHDPRPFPMAISDPALDVHAFVVTRWDGEPVNAAPDEHDDLHWFRPRDLAVVKLAHAASLPTLVSAVQAAADRARTERTTGMSLLFTA